MLSTGGRAGTWESQQGAWQGKALNWALLCDGGSFGCPDLPGAPGLPVCLRQPLAAGTCRPPEPCSRGTTNIHEDGVLPCCLPGHTVAQAPVPSRTCSLREVLWMPCPSLCGGIESRRPGCLSGSAFVTLGTGARVKLKEAFLALVPRPVRLRAAVPHSGRQVAPVPSEPQPRGSEAADVGYWAARRKGGGPAAGLQRAVNFNGTDSPGGAKLPAPGVAQGCQGWLVPRPQPAAWPLARARSHLPPPVT